ncbi:MAG: MEDS domain-containing protein [Acidimicrobiales bacterium]
MIGTHDHVVNIYEDRQDLVSELVSFVRGGLDEQEVVAVIARDVHRDCLEDGLRRAGVDVERSRQLGRYHVMDAAELLSQFMVEGRCDSDLVTTVIGGMLERLCDKGSPVRVFGEMVALLWDEGNVPAALELETLWNGLAREHAFSLYCAYPLSALAQCDDLAATNDICRLHSAVIPPASYSASVPAPLVGEGTDWYSQLFVPVPSSVRAARAFVAEALTQWDEAHMIDDASLVVSELVTNAVLHATSSFRVRVDRHGTRVRIAVQDVSPRAPRRRVIEDDATCGRGISLVDLLSRAWGSEVTGEGKIVWAELDRQTPTRAEP